MRSLILVLLFATSVQAQSLADAARIERERQAATKNVHVFTTEEARNLASPASSAAPATGTPTATKAIDDAVKKYADDLAKARAKVIELQDQETALQLQINDSKNAFLAPVTDQATQAEALEKLAETQAELATTQKDLYDAKKAAADLEAQGPPQPPKP